MTYLPRYEQDNVFEPTTIRSVRQWSRGYSNCLDVAQMHEADMIGKQFANHLNSAFAEGKRLDVGISNGI